MACDSESFNDTDIPMKNSTRLVILGAPKVGKTAVTNWLLSRPFEDYYIPTIEHFHKKIFKIRGEMYSLEILDTSGNDPFPAMKKLNIMIGDLFVLVFSLTDMRSYIQVKQLCEEIRELKKAKNEKQCTSNILIFGNKLDQVIENRVKNKGPLQQRCVDSIDAQSFAATFKSCYYSEISCKTLWGITGGFMNLLENSSLPMEILPTKHRRLSLEEMSSNKRRARTSKTRVGRVQIDSQSVNSSGDENTKPKYSSKIGADGNNSFKKSFKKMGFRRQLEEARGKVLLNSRRPSIRSEMKLLEIKSDKKSGNVQFSLQTRLTKSQKKIQNSKESNLSSSFFSRIVRCFKKS